MDHLLPLADPAPAQGFSLTNLLVLVLVVAVLYPVFRFIRHTASRRRRERWAEEEPDVLHYTEENDPDLRRNTEP